MAYWLKSVKGAGCLLEPDNRLMYKQISSSRLAYSDVYTVFNRL